MCFFVLFERYIIDFSIYYMTISKYISKVVYQEKTKHLIIGTDGVYFFYLYSYIASILLASHHHVYLTFV